MDSDVNHKRLRPISNSFSLEEPLAPSFWSVFGRDPTPQDRAAALETWKPLVDLIGEFQHLSDVVYSCRTQFPPGLLDALQTHHPTCKLHLRSFRFQSLHDQLNSPDELALITCPLLHSMSVLHTYRDSAGQDDFNGEAALQAVSLAPNLKHVRMLGCRPVSSPALHSARRRPRAKWNGFKPPFKAAGKGSLITLGLAGYSDRLDRAKLNDWASQTDFSELREMAFAIEDRTLLADMAINNVLPSLHTLVVTLERRKEDEQFKAAVEDFFSVLKPLRVLRLSGTLHRELLAKICERHGDTLRELSLRPYEDYYDMAGPPLELTSDDVIMLADKCNTLRDLRISIRRSMGNRKETKCYEALGRISTLRRVNLILDCTNPENPGEPSPEWDDFEKTFAARSTPRTYYGHIKRAIVNSAVDESLALSIWEVISENNPKLESLFIKPKGGSGFGRWSTADLSDIVHNVARSFRCTRIGTDESSNIEIVETSKKERQEQDDMKTAHYKTMIEKWGHKGLTGTSFTVFDKLWPFAENDSDWRLVWNSWPLTRSD